MKRIFSIILLSLLLCACSQADDVVDVPSSEASQSFLRSRQEVIDAATEAADILSDGTRASARVAESTVIPIVGTRSRAGSDTLMYIVNYADGQGFAIIAAPKMIEPVIYGNEYLYAETGRALGALGHVAFLQALASFQLGLERGLQRLFHYGCECYSEQLRC